MVFCTSSNVNLFVYDIYRHILRENSLIFTGASGRNGYLEVMKMMAEKYKKKMWGSVLMAYSRSD